MYGPYICLFGWDWDISEPDIGRRKAAIDGQIRLLELAAILEPKKLLSMGVLNPLGDNERDARISA